MVAAIDQTVAQLRTRTGAPVDLREAMQRMALEIAGRTMFSLGMDRYGATLRDFVMEYSETLGTPAFSRFGAAAGMADPEGFCPRALSPALDTVRRHVDGGAPRRRQARRRQATTGRAATRSV